MRRRPRATVFPDTHTMFPQPKHWPRLSGKTFEKRHMEKQCFSLLNGRRSSSRALGFTEKSRPHPRARAASTPTSTPHRAHVAVNRPAPTRAHVTPASCGRPRPAVCPRTPPRGRRSPSAPPSCGRPSDSAHLCRPQRFRAAGRCLLQALPPVVVRLVVFSGVDRVADGSCGASLRV